MNILKKLFFIFIVLLMVKPVYPGVLESVGNLAKDTVDFAGDVVKKTGEFAQDVVDKTKETLEPSESNKTAEKNIAPENGDTLEDFGLEQETLSAGQKEPDFEIDSFEIDEE